MVKTSCIALILILLVTTGHAQQPYRVYHSEFEKQVIENYFNHHSIAESSVDLQLVADQNVSSEDAKAYNIIYNKLLNEALNKKAKIKSDSKFLSWLFYKVHRNILKNYVQYSSLAQLFEKGNYDCLSATTLYTLLLTDLQYNIKIIETNYHIYLKVYTDQAQFLLESTDPINGFVFRTSEINDRLATYAAANEGMKYDYYRFNSKLNNAVGLDKLVGLQYYNKAVVSFNNHELINSLQLLEKATLFYNSERISEFGLLLAQQLYMDSLIDEQTKFDALSKVGQFIDDNKKVAIR